MRSWNLARNAELKIQEIIDELDFLYWWQFYFLPALHFVYNSLISHSLHYSIPNSPWVSHGVRRICISHLEKVTVHNRKILAGCFVRLPLLLLESLQMQWASMLRGVTEASHTQNIHLNIWATIAAAMWENWPSGEVCLSAPLVCERTQQAAGLRKWAMTKWHKPNLLCGIKWVWSDSL